MKSVSFLALAVVCSAQEHHPCVSPKQWEGRRMRTDWNKQYTEFGRIIYDETNTRIRTIEETDVSTGRDYYDVLRLHNVNMEYRLNLRTRQCNVTKVTLPFRTIGVRPGARFRFEAELGAAGVPGEHLTALVFEGTYWDGAKYVVQMSSTVCVPMNLDVSSNTTNEHFHESYYDIQIGIGDPAAFVPEEDCTA